MKVIVLAGGHGSRLAEETEIRPKPLVEIGGKPILWHIMKHYSFYGYNEFVIALGYKGELIKKYFVDYNHVGTDIRVDFQKKIVERKGDSINNWIVDLVDTGSKTQTGGRLKKLKEYIGDDTFMLTWGDGVSDVNINELIKFHKSHGKLATVTAVRPPARYGYMEFDGDNVTNFTEKPQIGEGWINGAFFILEPKVLDYVENDETVWEHEPMHNLAINGELKAFKHTSFWQCMDTLREKHYLNSLWDSNKAPWKIW